MLRDSENGRQRDEFSVDLSRSEGESYSHGVLSENSPRPDLPQVMRPDPLFQLVTIGGVQHQLVGPDPPHQLVVLSVDRLNQPVVPEEPHQLEVLALTLVGSRTMPSSTWCSCSFSVAYFCGIVRIPRKLLSVAAELLQTSQIDGAITSAQISFLHLVIPPERSADGETILDFH